VFSRSEVPACLVAAAVFKTVAPYVIRAAGGFDSHALPLDLLRRNTVNRQVGRDQFMVHGSGEEVLGESAMYAARRVGQLASHQRKPPVGGVAPRDVGQWLVGSKMLHEQAQRLPPDSAAY
jgi:hypothetical protein